MTDDDAGRPTAADRDRLGFPARAPRFDSIDAVREGLAGVDYLADDGIAGVVYLADRLAKPVLVEGPAGHGQDRAGQVGGPAHREPAHPPPVLRGPRRVQGALRVELQEAAAADPGRLPAPDAGSSSRRTSSPRSSSSPARLLEAIRSPEPVVLLIDEVDRVELETEALLLEILSEYQVSIPELGTVRATQIPLVFLTSNNTRELSEALKRRCLYLHIDYPELDRERAIIQTRVPGISEALADQVARIVRSIRDPRAEEGTLGLGDPRLGPDPGGARRRVDRRRAGPRHPAHPAQVPVRHRPGGQGAGRRSTSPD